MSGGASARMRRGNGPSSCQDTRDTHPCLAGSSDPQFLNENYNQHSNAKCQCQGRFDAKRDSPGSFQIGKTVERGIRLLILLLLVAWLVGQVWGWDNFGLGSVLSIHHPDQTRLCQCPLPLSILTRARISKEPSYASCEGEHNRGEPFYAVTQTQC